MPGTAIAHINELLHRISDSCNFSIGIALQDALDDLISENLIEPQLAMKICSNYDKTFSEIIAERVKSRLTFKVRKFPPKPRFVRSQSKRDEPGI